MPQPVALPIHCAYCGGAVALQFAEWTDSCRADVPALDVPALPAGESGRVPRTDRVGDEATLRANDTALRERPWWYSRNPFHYAFSFTAATLLFLGAGTVGYKLDKHDRFVSHTAWADGPIWWEMGAGIVCALIAAVAWHRAIRSLNDSRLTREPKARH